MRLVAVGLALPLLLAATPAAPATDVPGPHRFTHSCDLSLNVVDPDPRGLNVRAAPGKPPGKVIAVLEPVGDWTQVHVVGQAGEWLLIDRAEAVDDEAADGMREVFRGGGWVHASGLGVSELYVGGEGVVLRAGPSEDAAEVLRIDDYDRQPTQVRVLGCRARWLEVEAGGKRGFTRTWCNNERTTCS
jgi:hypothetical protein